MAADYFKCRFLQNIFPLVCVYKKKRPRTGEKRGSFSESAWAIWYFGLWYALNERRIGKDNIYGYRIR